MRLVSTSAPEISELPAEPQPLPRLVGYPDIPVGRRGPAVNAERLFDEKLASAKQHFAVLDQLLKAAGEKIDAAKPGEDADVEHEADMVQKHLFLYNEDLAVARDLWLRFNLSGDANSRLDGMPSPVTLGLPAFATPAQAQRMGQQLAAIGRRLRGDNASMDALVTGMEVTETAATAAGILTGAGALVVAAKTTGRWAVVKMVVAGAAAIAADRLTEAGLRRAGASDQTIRGVRLAAAAITLILLHRANKRAAPQGPTPEPPSGTGQTPPAEPPSEHTPAAVEPPPGAPAGSTPPTLGAPQEPTPEAPSGSAQTPPAGPPPAHAPAAVEPPPGAPAAPNPPEPVAPPPNKPPLPPPRAQSTYSWHGHRTAAEAEEALAREVHALPDEVVVRWGDPIGSNGADVISVNMKTGKVTLWDAKYRSRPDRIRPSDTFEDPGTLGKAIRKATDTIKTDTTLPADTRAAALKNLEDGRVTTRTVGKGNAKNSTLK